MQLFCMNTERSSSYVLILVPSERERVNWCFETGEWGGGRERELQLVWY